jgi:hypothetical protein
VLGKWAGRTLHVLTLILAGLPLLTFAAIFGGIDFGQLAVLTLVTADVAVAVSALSVAVSVLAPNVRVALMRIYLLIAALLLIPVAFNLLIDMVGVWATVTPATRGATAPALAAWKACATALLSLHPYPMLFAAPASVVEASSRLSMFTAVYAATAAVSLLWGMLRLRAAARKAGAVRPPRVLFPKRRQRLVGRYPLVWKEWFFDRESGRRFSGETALALGYLTFYAGCWYLQFQAGYMPNAVRTAYLGELLRWGVVFFFAAAFVRVGVRAATAIASERERDSWTSLLLTPLSGREIIVGKLTGAMKPAAFSLFWLAPLLTAAVIFDQLSLAALVELPFLIAAHAFFAASLGIYQSLKRRNGAWSMMATLGVLFFFSIGGAGLLLLWISPLLLVIAAGLKAVFVPGLVDLALVTSPVGMLYMAMGHGSTNLWNRTGWFIVGVEGFFVSAYVAVALIMLRASIRSFAADVGRSDGGAAQALSAQDIKGLALSRERERAQAVKKLEAPIPS